MNYYSQSVDLGHGLMRLCRVLALIVFVTVPVIGVARAGGGPENVFLLVNPRSQDSLTVANHYVSLRKLPASNVFYLKWDPEKHSMSGAAFRDRILLPVLKEIEQRGLEGQIDYLVYSCDYPWQLHFQSDFPKEKFPTQLRPVASLTGATYLSQFVQEKRKEMFNLNTNFYAIKALSGMTVSRGFQSAYHWAPGGKRVKDSQKGLTYRLSTMLGVTCDRGSTVEEVLRYLRRSTEADGTSPPGTIYLMENEDIRTKVRHGSFPDVVRELSSLGVQAEILKGVLPSTKKDVMGITTGTKRFNLIASKVEMLPGAIGDNLTSTGGYFVKRKPWKPPANDPTKKPPGLPQTVLTDFLRAGSAGASGTVVEPYALQAKFPLPSIHVHYARGCSLAEAFYQSVTGPFQLLVVGDPLCRPWARIPEVSVEGIADGQRVNGQVKIKPSATLYGARKVARFELFVDGVRAERCLVDETISLDTTTIADGHHELRVVAIDDTPIETQGRWIGRVTVKNGRDALQLSLAPASRVSIRGALKITVTSTTNDEIVILHNEHVLGRIRGGQGSVRVDANKLGKGPVAIRARTVSGSGLSKPGLYSRPVAIEVY
jgi:uncharacterized protein (TIGR03790 family)